MTNNPNKIIKFNPYTRQIDAPTLILRKRNFEVIGEINCFNNWNFSFVGNGIDEISFDVHKFENGKKCKQWDNIIDFAIVEVQDYGMFEIQVDKNDNEETIKSVVGQSLEVELGQLYIHDMHINDEDAITAEPDGNVDFIIENGIEKFVPTVFCKTEKDAGNDPNWKHHSLLHRVISDKAPHWSIGHVPEFIVWDKEKLPERSNKFQRVFTIGNENIYSFLTETLAQEANVLFTFDTYNRIINCYNLEEYVYEDGTVIDSIGEDTTIFVDKVKLANSMSLTSQHDEVKNCFRVLGGDDIINDYVRVVNLNGSNYIYNFAQFQLDDMPKELSSALLEYQEFIESDEIKNEYYGTEEVCGQDGIFTRYCKLLDEWYNLKSVMMPGRESILPEDWTAQKEYDEMFKELTNPGVAVNDYASYSEDAFEVLTKNVLEIAKIHTDSRYTIEVVKDEENKPIYDAENHIWHGSFKLYRTIKKDDNYTSPIIAVSIIENTGENAVEYQKQKCYKSLAKTEVKNEDFIISEMSDEEVRDYFSKYCLSRLKSFEEAYQACLSILGTYKNIEDEIGKELYDSYKKKYDIVVEYRKIREEQIDEVTNDILATEEEQRIFLEKTNFKKFLDERSEEDKTPLFTIFSMYRREDDYQNSNYSSEGLSDAEIVEKAKELIDVAKREIKKACILQRSITVDINNIFTIPEFKKLHDKFALFNYIRTEIDDEIIKLRIVQINYDSNSPDKINVTFADNIESVGGTVSDVKSILAQTSNISTSYNATMLQAKSGEKANEVIVNMRENGLDATQMLLQNSSDSEITMTQAGLMAKQMTDSGIYDSCQLRITGNGIYLTKDNWASLSEAIGKVVVDGQEQYGVIADVLCGDLLLGKQLVIKNDDGSVLINGYGIVIENIDGEVVFRADADGAYIKGTVNATKGKFSGEIGIGGESYDNFVVTENGDVTSKGLLSLANGGISYDGNTLAVSGNIISNNVTITGGTIDNVQLEGASITWNQITDANAQAAIVAKSTINKDYLDEKKIVAGSVSGQNITDNISLSNGDYKRNVAEVNTDGNVVIGDSECDTIVKGKTIIFNDTTLQSLLDRINTLEKANIALEERIKALEPTSE